MTDPIARLQAWNAGHKRRAVQITHDDGYGAACWDVTLFGVLNAPEQRVVAYEGSDQPHDRDIGRYIPVWGANDDWPGLAAVIHAAIDEAERLEGATLCASGTADTSASSSPS